MITGEIQQDLHDQIDIFLKAGFAPRYEDAPLSFPSSPLWHRLRRLNTELWLDTGSIEDAEALWTQEFSALTTNNPLLNREIQTGRYDTVIPEMAAILEPYNLTDREKRLEFAFMLNAWHAMRLVERFESYVSVEEHTDLAADVPSAVEYARRYHRLCPERFIVKIPFTPAGLLATRLLSREGVPVNHTLGFSARQNYLAARLASPAFVNVFLGRLNSLISRNDLGTGDFVGEKTTLASQAAIREIRTQYGIATRQIGASLRSSSQIPHLAGIDVMTMPPTAAGEFISTPLRPEDITDRSSREYTTGLNPHVDTEALRLQTLWDVTPQLVACLDDLENENLDAFTPDDLVAFLHSHGCADILVRWADEDLAAARVQGKIPHLATWRERLAAGEFGLDALMNLAGLESFAADQLAMDDHVAKVTAHAAHHV